VLVALGLAGAALFSYRRPLVPLTTLQKSVLACLRALALAAVFLFACRPIVLRPPAVTGDVIIPVLVDVSRSMRVPDADGRPRIAAARQLLESRLMPELSRIGHVELFRVGEGLVETSAANLAADARRSDISSAVSAARERFRGRRVAGVIVISDGGDTTPPAADSAVSGGAPVFAIGVGSPAGVQDREVVGMTAGDPRLDQALVDLHVTTVSSGFGRDPYMLRLLANGQLIESRRVVPGADGTPTDQTFVVTPDPLNATVYTADIPADPSESIVENNTRNLLLSPAAPKRRLLILSGSPGFEHSFLVRALSVDPSFEIDAVVRKGKDDSGRDTFLIQAAGGRGASLISGFPPTREALFGYDAVLIGNLEGEFFGRTQMELLADFVNVRGGGLLMMGGRSFLERGIPGSPLEQALPVELSNRRGVAATAPAADGEGSPTHNTVMVTADGLVHPIMRMAATPGESRKAWASLPPLAGAALVGAARPGATVLAVTQSTNGATLPLVAVQRYGRGRSMMFSGEAAWRWKMLRPATDRTYEFFWRQAARWLSSDAPDPIELRVPDASSPGDSIPVKLEVRDAAFAPVSDAAVETTVTAPGGRTIPLQMRPSTAGEQAATFVADTAGLYRVRAEARRGAALLGSADRWFYVGGADPEFADPRLNEGFLRRLARRSGGQYVAASEADRAVAAVTSSVPQTVEPVRRDLWHEPWAFALVIAVLSAEWLVRRLWGMR
jgi:uncharacterized membrane protein